MRLKKGLNWLFTVPQKTWISKKKKALTSVIIRVCNYYPVPYKRTLPNKHTPCNFFAKFCVPVPNKRTPCVFGK